MSRTHVSISNNFPGQTVEKMRNRLTQLMDRLPADKEVTYELRYSIEDDADIPVSPVKAVTSGVKPWSDGFFHCCCCGKVIPKEQAYCSGCDPL
jgi:hypothetical protein